MDFKDFNLDSIESSGGTGIDSFLEVHSESDVPMKKNASTRVKIASLEQLNPFHRISAETLVHKSTKDLWTVTRENDGLYIQRLFRDDGTPLKD
jgi:hypothetical protein